MGLSEGRLHFWLDEIRKGRLPYYLPGGEGFDALWDYPCSSNERFSAPWNELDRAVLARCKHDYFLASETWGGHHCPGCGLEVAPRCLDRRSLWLDGTHIDGASDNACSSPWFRGECPGEDEDWQEKLAERYNGG